MYFCSNSWQNKIAQLGVKRHFLLHEGAMRIARPLGWVISRGDRNKVCQVAPFSIPGQGNNIVSESLVFCCRASFWNRLQSHE